MTAITTTDARAELAELINQVSYGQERVTITKNGKPSVVMISAEDYALFEALEDRMDIEAAKKALKSGTVSWEAVRKKAGL